MSTANIKTGVHYHVCDACQELWPCGRKRMHDCPRCQKVSNAPISGHEDARFVQIQISRQIVLGR